MPVLIRKIKQPLANTYLSYSINFGKLQRNSSVEEVYNLIVKDLTDAIPMLEGYKRPQDKKTRLIRQ